MSTIEGRKKIGILDEDLIAPATGPVISKYFKCESLYGIRILNHINLWKHSFS